MRSINATARNGNYLLKAILVSCLTVAVGKAADLSGTYVDTGIRVASGASANTADEPSLCALLKFEFTPEVAEALRHQSASVKIVQADHHFEVVVYDLDGAETWSAQWTEGERFSQQKDRIILRSPAGRFGDDKVILILEQLPEHGLLQVSVQRIVPTMFGPSARKLDTALFNVVP